MQIAILKPGKTVMTKRLEDHSCQKTLAKTNQFFRARPLRFGQVEALSGLLPPDLRAALCIADLDLLVCEKDTLMHAKDSFLNKSCKQSLLSCVQ